MGNTLTGYMFNRENRERIELRNKVKSEINEFKKDQQNKAVTEELKRCQNLVNESWSKRDSTARKLAYQTLSSPSVEEELRIIIISELRGNSYDEVLNTCLENCKRICNKKDLNLLLHKIYLLRTEYGSTCDCEK